MQEWSVTLHIVSHQQLNIQWWFYFSHPPRYETPAIGGLAHNLVTLSSRRSHDNTLTIVTQPVGVLHVGYLPIL
jgi:hypothetical protein